MQQDTIWMIAWAVVVGGTFLWLWRKGHLLRLRDYLQQTREELRKCTWPSWEELKGSTVVIGISIVLLGAFTILADFIFTILVRWVDSIT